jgi:hypothetical protein
MQKIIYFVGCVFTFLFGNFEDVPRAELFGGFEDQALDCG